MTECKNLLWWPTAIFIGAGLSHLAYNFRLRVQRDFELDKTVGYSRYIDCMTLLGQFEAKYREKYGEAFSAIMQGELDDYTPEEIKQGARVRYCLFVTKRYWEQALYSCRWKWPFLREEQVAEMQAEHRRFRSLAEPLERHYRGDQEDHSSVFTFP